MEELRADIDKVRALVPGTLRLSLHAIYGEFGGKAVDRDALEPAHFAGWMDWARRRKLALDFNATLFSHPLASSGWTLCHPDPGVRAFWIEHTKRARKVAAAMGSAQASPCVNNTWIPDGSKDKTAARSSYRNRLADSLDEIFEEKLPASQIEDAVEGKLFGIGAEYFTAGSHDFYLGYAATRRVFLTMDMGHFHPTESVADKISAVLPSYPAFCSTSPAGTLGFGSRPHIGRRTLRSGLRGRPIPVARQDTAGLDYFDASINRIGAWGSARGRRARPSSPPP